MTRKPTTENRLQELERSIQDLQRDLLSTQGRIDRGTLPMDVRLAKTWTADPDDYPDENVNTLPIVFLDGTYTRSVLDQDPTFTDHSADAEDVAIHRGGDWIERGTDVVVLTQDNRHWIISEAESAGPQIKIGFVDPVSETFISHNQSGRITFLERSPEGSCGDFDILAESTDACNALMQRLWKGSIVAVMKVVVDGESASPSDLDTQTVAQLDVQTVAQLDTLKIVDAAADPGRWYIIQAYSAKHLRGKLSENIDETTITSIANYLVEIDGHYPISSPAAGVFFWNLFGLEGSAGDDVILKWSDTDNTWLLMAFAGGGGRGNIRYGTADEDIDNGAIGDVVISDFDPPQTHAVTNTLSHRIWEGSPVVVAKTELISTTSPTVLQDYRVVNAYTARKIRGTIKTVLLPSDATGVLENVVPMDGYYAPADLDSVTFTNEADDFGCVGYEAFAHWDEATKVWMLDHVKRPTVIHATATAGGDYCGGAEPSPYLLNLLTAFGYGCIPDAGDLTITNPKGWRFKEGDYLQLLIDLETLDAIIDTVEMKPHDVVTSFEYDSAGHRILADKMAVVVSTCGDTTPTPVIGFTRVDVMTAHNWVAPKLLGPRSGLYVVESVGATNSDVDFYNCDGSQT